METNKNQPKIHQGKRLREIMAANRLTPTELARRSGYTRAAIYSMLDRPSLSTQAIGVMCDIFEVKSNFFYDEEVKVIARQPLLPQSTNNMDYAKIIQELVETNKNLSAKVEEDRELFVRVVEAYEKALKLTEERYIALNKSLELAGKQLSELVEIDKRLKAIETRITRAN